MTDSKRLQFGASVWTDPLSLDFPDAIVDPNDDTVYDDDEELLDESSSDDDDDEQEEDQESSSSSSSEEEEEEYDDDSDGIHELTAVDLLDVLDPLRVRQLEILVRVLAHEGVRKLNLDWLISLGLIQEILNGVVENLVEGEPDTNLVIIRPPKQQQQQQQPQYSWDSVSV